MKKENKRNSEETKNTAGYDDNQSVNNTDDQDNTTSEQEQIASEKEVVAEIDEFKEKYIRLYSEFDNYRKRTNKEKIDIIANANEGLLKDLLPTLDDFERAISNNENTDDIEALREGFKLIFNKLFNTLESKGLKVMATKGNKFDSELHDAIANIPSPSPEMVGFVVDDVQKGYYLKEKVIRHAKVVVGQ